ncbi:hypothetical protein V2J09_003729 [Rumex salicifolius]
MVDGALFCSDCKVVWDHATGDIICTDCALVLEAHYIDDTPEWRVFSDDSKNRDPIRVGQPASTLDASLNDGLLSTVISDHSSLPKNRLANHRVPHSPLHASFNAIADMLGLAASVKYRASEIFKKAEDQKISKRRNHDAVLAACLYVACSQENTRRTVKEICYVANGISMKDFLRAKKHIVTQLKVEVGHVEMGTVQTGDMLRRFCSHLGMNNQSIMAAQEAVENLQTSDQIDVRRNPKSVAVAIIYAIVQLSKEKKPMLVRDIANATGAAEDTIRSSYNDLYLHLPTIIPTWFAGMEDLCKLLWVSKGMKTVKR